MPGARQQRLCGIGGLFVFCGLFWSRKLGRYRAYITDPRRAVVLRFGNKVVVVTPDEPDSQTNPPQSGASKIKQKADDIVHDGVHEWMNSFREWLGGPRI